MTFYQQWDAARPARAAEKVFAERKIVKLRNEAIVSERFQKFAKNDVYEIGLFWLGFDAIAAGLVGAGWHHVSHFVSHFCIFNVMHSLGFYAGRMRQVIKGAGSNGCFGCGGCAFVCDAWAFRGRASLRGKGGDLISGKN